MGGVHNCTLVITSDLTAIKRSKDSKTSQSCPSEAEPLPENSWIRAIFEHPSGF